MVAKVFFSRLSNQEYIASLTWEPGNEHSVGSKDTSPPFTYV